MAKNWRSIPYDEFSSNLAHVVEWVIRKKRAVMVETKAGDRVVVRPVELPTPWSRAKTGADFEAFRSAAGSWSDVDTEHLLKELYESRAASSRPPVEL